MVIIFQPARKVMLNQLAKLPPGRYRILGEIKENHRLDDGTGEICLPLPYSLGDFVDVIIEKGRVVLSRRVPAEEYELLKLLRQEEIKKQSETEKVPTQSEDAEYEKYTRLIREMGYSDEEINKKVEEIMKEAVVVLPDGVVDYLFSRVGAIKLLYMRLGGKEQPETITIDKIMDNMQGIVYARVVSVGQPRDVVTKDGKILRALDLVVGDSTGAIPVTIWENADDFAKEIKEGDVLKFSGSYYKNGYLRYSSISKVNEAEAPPLPPVDEIPARPRRFLSTMIKDYGKIYEVRATVVGIARTNYIYTVCPDCNKKIAGEYCRNCASRVTPLKKLMVPVLVDDGTACLRCVLWDELVRKITGKGDELIVACELDSNKFYTILAQLLLFRDLLITGYVEQGEFGWELRAIAVNKPDLKKELKFIKITR